MEPTSSRTFIFKIPYSTFGQIYQLRKLSSLFILFKYFYLFIDGLSNNFTKLCQVSAQVFGKYIKNSVEKSKSSDLTAQADDKIVDSKKFCNRIISCLLYFRIHFRYLIGRDYIEL